MILSPEELAATMAPTNWRDKSEIAALSCRDICRLHWDQMVEVVRCSELPVAPDVRFDAIEGDTLVRMVYSARRFCRNAGF